MDQNMKETIRQAQAGNEEAFDIVYQNYYQSVYNFVYRKCNSDADTKDIVQETFLEVYRSLGKLQDINAFYSWLLTVAHSKCVKLFRKNKKNLIGFEGVENSIKFKEERVYMNPQLHADNDSESEVLMRLIDSLTPKQAEFIKLSYLEQLKMTEIAAVLKIPLGTVKTRSLRAKEELRIKIAEYEKQEQRKLHFNADMIVPITSLSLFATMSNLPIAKGVSKFYKIATQNVLTSVSTASLSVLMVGGGVVATQQVLNTATVSKTNQEVVSQEKTQTKPQSAIKETTNFPETRYGEQVIANDQEAYFVCMNFAIDEEAMKQKTNEELNEIQPVVEIMKKRNSTYYQTMTEEGWSTLFEQYHEA